MKLYRFVIKDAVSRRKRVLYASLGVAFGVAVVVSLLTIALAGEKKVYEELDKYGANLMISPAVNDLDLQLGDLSMGTLSVGENFISEDKLPEIRRIADQAIREELGITDEGDIVTIAPKLYGRSGIDGTSVTVAGIDLIPEVLIKNWWSIAEGRYPEAENEVLLGARSGAVLDYAVGENIQIEGDSFVLAGILAETGANEDFYVFISLHRAQELFGREGLISSADIRALCLGCPVEVIADSINENIPGVRAVAVKQIAKAEMDLMDRINELLLALAGITLLIGTFGVVNTMMSAVHERLRDIGIMKAIGGSPGQVARVFLYEAVIIGAIGGLVGYVAGTLLSYVVGPMIFDGIEIGFVLRYLPYALGLAVFVAIIASSYPAYRASRIKIADSMRSI